MLTVTTEKCETFTHTLPNGDVVEIVITLLEDKQVKIFIGEPYNVSIIREE